MDIGGVDFSHIADSFGIVSFPLTLFQFWQASRQHQAAEEQRSVDQTVDGYLEWLRREGHREITQKLDESGSAMAELRQLIEMLTNATAEHEAEILSELADFKAAFDTRFDVVEKMLGTINTKISLFAAATTTSQDIANFEKRYLECVKKEYDKLKFIGLKNVREVAAKTSISFVSLNIRPDHDEGEPLPAEQVLLNTPRIAIRGPAGSGKTTLFSWIALQCTEADDVENPWRHGIPFVISLRNLVESEKGVPRLDRLVEYTLRRDQYALTPPAGWIESTLSEGRAVILVDGVDELPQASGLISGRGLQISRRTIRLGSTFLLDHLKKKVTKAKNCGIHLIRSLAATWMIWTAPLLKY